MQIHEELDGIYLEASYAQPTNFMEWREFSFAPGEWAMPEISGPKADPDGDGLTNDLEYVLNLRPKIIDDSPIGITFIRPDLGPPTAIEIKAPIAIGTTDTIVEVGESRDLRGHSAIPFIAEVTEDNGLRQVTIFRAALDPEGERSAFFQLLIKVDAEIIDPGD